MSRYVVVLILTLITAIITLSIKSATPLHNKQLFRFPMIFSGWQGIEIKLDESVLESLETPYAIMRDYRKDIENTVNLVIIWYDDKEIAFHAPESCLGGVGNLVKEKRKRVYKDDKKQSYEVTELIAEMNGRKLLVNYFFITHNKITGSQVAARIEVLKHRLTMQRADIAMVRLIVPVTDSVTSTRNICEAFFWDSLPKIHEYALLNK